MRELAKRTGSIDFIFTIQALIRRINEENKIYLTKENRLDVISCQLYKSVELYCNTFPIFFFFLLKAETILK